MEGGGEELGFCSVKDRDTGGSEQRGLALLLPLEVGGKSRWEVNRRTGGPVLRSDRVARLPASPGRTG